MTGFEFGFAKREERCGVMRFGSVCSGIEAASQAWRPLGWEPAFFSEIEKFPSAVLAHHHPDVPNHGDMTQFQEWPDYAIDVLAGGTPCQSFSVAGLRKGLADPRGNLMLTYLAIAKRYRPRWVAWENVPGVLSSNEGRDFGTFLGALGQLGYGWAYRVLDAQHTRTRRFPFAVPQRRRRVFVVGYLGDWRSAAAVLFDAQSLRGDSAPRREAGKVFASHAGRCVETCLCQRPCLGSCAGKCQLLRQSAEGSHGSQVALVAPTIPSRSTGGGGLETDFDLDGGLTAASGIPAVCGTLSDGAHNGGGLNGQGAYTGRILPVAIQERAVSENPDNGPQGAGFRTDGASYTLEARNKVQAVAFAENSRAEIRLCGGDGAVSSQLTTGGGKPGQGHPTIAFDCKGTQGQTQTDGAHPPLRPMGHLNSHTNAGGQAAVAFTCSEQANSFAWERDHAPCLTGQQPSDTSNIQTGVRQVMAVRRLTPVECERLMGFPDNYTRIPYRNKPAEQCPDGPRYKALGNSWAVNCAEWIGERIALVDALTKESAA